MIRDINDFIDLANEITHNEKAFDLRKRMNPHHSKADKEYEAKIHISNQRLRWHRLKKYFTENRNYVMAYAESGKISTKEEKKTIKAVAKVIDEEIDNMLLLGIGETDEDIPQEND